MCRKFQRSRMWGVRLETRGFMFMTAHGVRRVKAALSQWVKVPPGNLLQSEATGATVEVTKWLKPPVKRASNMVAARVYRP